MKNQLTQGKQKRVMNIENKDGGMDDYAARKGSTEYFNYLTSGEFMRFLCLITGLFMFMPLAFGGGNKLVHDWHQVKLQGAIQLISNHKAPPPFSLDGEPEATLTMQAAKLVENLSLPKLVKVEVEAIRKGTKIMDYVEKDGHTPDKGIATYFQKINGHKVAFIKYRTNGLKGRPAVLPRTVIHAFTIKNGKVYFTHLIVLYGGHQDEVRGDQIRIMKSILKK